MAQCLSSSRRSVRVIGRPALVTIFCDLFKQSLTDLIRHASCSSCPDKNEIEDHLDVQIARTNSRADVSLGWFNILFSITL